MVKIKRRFRKFRIDQNDDLEDYNSILNDPLCNITGVVTEKEKVQEYNDRGNLIRQQDIIYFLVHWEERIL